MTKAYSKISGYDRPHVYVFVSDKKISTLESVFKNFRIRPENTLDTCGRKPYSLYDDALYAGLKVAC